MKKCIFGVIVLWMTGCGTLNAETLMSIKEYNWNGFYFGPNAGYWWPQNNIANTVTNLNFINPLIPLRTSVASNTPATVETNQASSNVRGFFAGGQVGYNYQVKERLVVGIDADLDGLNRSQTSTVKQTIPLASFLETYTSTFTIKKSINWLGTIRGKAGFLLHPSLLVYATGGLAYGGVSLKESLTANEALGSSSYPTIMAQNNINQTRAGWIAGAGVDWMFKPQWSAKLEYAYYNLGTINSNFALSPLWGTANIHSSAKFVAETLGIGLNYHFDHSIT